ncbi:hypothetical protein H9P43_008274 [Blastocladiella emersonii ATCC 22665]|nr:hypothetical protein H9P43_008274 [Blastocladiella emersonii ATCC 22665]
MQQRTLLNTLWLGTCVALLLSTANNAIASAEPDAQPAAVAKPPAKKLLTKRGLAVNERSEHYVVDILPIHPRSGLPLRSLRKRSVDDDGGRVEYENHVVFEVAGYRDPLALELKRNDDFISPNYQHISGSADSSVHEIRHEPPPNCYYHGSVKGVPTSLVAISTCQGLHGVIHVNDSERFVIHALDADEPLPADATDDDHHVSSLHRRHVLVRDTGYDDDDDVDGTGAKRAYCGQTAPASHTSRLHGWSDGHEWISAESLLKEFGRESESSSTSPAVSSLDKRQTLFRVKQNKTIELMVASDYQRFQAWGDETETSVFEMVNYVNALYAAGGLLPSPHTIVVTLAGTYTARAPMWIPENTKTIDADAILNTFCEWREAQLQNKTNLGNFLSSNDVGHLLTGRTMTSGASAVADAASIEGYANVGALCTSDKSCGVVRGIRVIQVATQATVLAHEMGHNLGSGHDGANNDCPNRGYIMEPSSCKDCGFLASQWSNCTREAVASFFATSDTTCMDVAPTLCGNGVVDPGEQCDSGDRVNGSACCTRTCKLRSGAACDDRNGKCCNKCQFVAAGTVCRSALRDGGDRESCDVADVCTGNSTTCPDVKRANGATCLIDVKNNATVGTCNRGYCQSRTASCARVGYRYDPACDAGREQTCLLYCRGDNGCIRLSYQATTQLSVVAPDFSACRNPNGDDGYCDAGKCITNSLTEQSPTGTTARSDAGGRASGPSGPVLVAAALAVLAFSLI